jgi:outer membrane protein
MNTKTIFSSLLIGFLLLVGASTYAQDKFAHVNSLAIVSQMPEYKSAQAALTKEETELAGAYEELIDEYIEKENELIEKGPEMMDAIRESKTEYLFKLQQKIQEFEISAQEQLMTREEELLEPILEKANSAIQTVAKANGYTYVLDVASGAILYAPDSRDISDLVKAELGI